MIHLVSGPQGAGKTRYARQLADARHAVCFSIDEWMGELYGPDLPTPLDLPWIMQRVRRCEQRIWAVAGEIVQRGGHVVLDIGGIKVEDRARFREQARQAQLPLQQYWVTAPQALRRSRIRARNVQQGETFSFEVSPEMFDFIEQHFEAASTDELADAIVIDSLSSERRSGEDQGR